MTGRSPPRVSLGALVERFGGEFGGDLRHEVVGFAALDSARGDQLAFVTAARYRAAVAVSAAGAILVAASDAAALPDERARLWVCRDPYLHFARIAQHFEAIAGDRPEPGVDPTATVDPSAAIERSATIGPQVVVGRDAVVGPDVRIGAHAVIGAGVRVGAATVIHPGVVVYPGCAIGARCIVHSGAVLGADGFGFAKDGSRWVKIPQVGGVRIGDDVEIGANTTIDRGALDDTVIGNGVKLDNQIQIGHNVRVGDDTIMAAFVGIAGSAVVGRRCLIGGAARIMGHVTIADDVVVSTQTFVSRSIAKAGQYTGYYPMAEHASFERSAAVLRRLDGLRDRVKRLESERGATASAAVHETPHETPRPPSRDTPEPERPA